MNVWLSHILNSLLIFFITGGQWIGSYPDSFKVCHLRSPFDFYFVIVCWVSTGISQLSNYKYTMVTSGRGTAILHLTPQGPAVIIYTKSRAVCVWRCVCVRKRVRAHQVGTGLNAAITKRKY